MSDPLSTTASVVNITTTALQGIKFLFKEIENIRKAPGSIKQLQHDLQAVQTILEAWKALGQNDSMVALAVRNCEEACREFSNNLKHWMRHSSDQKIATRDRFRVAVLEENAITSLSTQLNSCKTTLTLAIATSLAKNPPPESRYAKTIKYILQDRGALGVSDGLESMGYGHRGKGELIEALLTLDTSYLDDDLISEIESRRSEVRKEVFECLGAITTENDFENYRDLRLDETCEWIFTHPTFVDWKSKDAYSAKYLWIHAPPGFGKSVLCANIVEKLSAEPGLNAAYFFCSSEREDQRDSLAIVRSWVWQLVQYDNVALKLAYSRFRQKRSSVSRNDIWDLLKQIARSKQNCIFVVDGLDECHRTVLEHKHPSKSSRGQFLNRLKSTLAGVSCRVLVASRDESDIRPEFCVQDSEERDYSIKELTVSNEDVRDDLLRFSRYVVEEKLGGKPKEMQGDLAMTIANKSEGMFLWVRMQKEQLRGTKNSKQLHRIINEAPINLEHLYDRSWQEISKLPLHDRQRVEAVLHWVIFALRPLTVNELVEALLIQDDDTVEDLQTDELPDHVDQEYISSEIVGLCCSLLEVRSTNQDDTPGLGTVHLVHFTVREYLLPKTLKVGRSLSNFEYHNNHLAGLCLRYLQYKETWNIPGCGDTFTCRPFRKYATTKWYQHINRSTENFDHIMNQVNNFFSGTNCWYKWRAAFESSSEVEDSHPEDSTKASANPIYYASLFNLPETISFLYENGTSLDTIGGKYGTALQAACAKGHIDVSHLLIDLGANIDTQCGIYGCALNAASKGGDVNLVEHLIGKGASVSAPDETSLNALHYAVRYGHYDVVRLLLDKGANVDTPDKSKQTPLVHAIAFDNVTIVGLLLDKGADISAADKWGQQPLLISAHWSSFELVQLLLLNGAELTASNIYGSTPLIAATSRENKEIVELFLDWGANVSSGTKQGWNPLLTAASKGNLEIVKLLLDRGADLAAANNYGTSVMVAASNGHNDVVRHLLDRGADPSTLVNGATAISLAVGYGWFETTRILLERGAKMPGPGPFGFKPLHFAVYNNRLDLAQLVLKWGADVSATSEIGRTSLHMAAMNGNIDMIRLLLGFGAKANQLTRRKETALHLAAQYGEVKAMELLQQHGADTKAQDIFGRTPLDWAESQGVLNIAGMEGKRTDQRSQRLTMEENICVIEGHLQKSKSLHLDWQKLNNIGRLYLYLHNDEAAAAAFEQLPRVYSPPENHWHPADCDVCKQRILHVRYVCRVCPDTDLCETCMLGYSSGKNDHGEILRWCVGHDFLRVPRKQA